MKFLIVDDNPGDRELIVRQLRREFGDAECVEVFQRKDFEAAVARGDVDVVLTDYQLNWTDGLWILSMCRAYLPDIPVIMFTDTGGEEIAVDGMKAGLSDYVLKSHPQRMPIAVKESLEKAQLRRARDAAEAALRQEKAALERRVEERTIALKALNERLLADIAQRNRVETMLRESEERFRSLFEHSFDGVLLTLPDGRILAANPAACQIFGRTAEEICRVGRNGLVDVTDPRWPAVLEEEARTGTFTGELSHVREDGTTFPAELSSVVFKDPQGRKRTGIIIRDITARKRAEEQLRAALQEKEVLLKEIHHRVKNNLQVISSLLDLQSGYSQDPHVRAVFQESQQRIRGMALIHEMLYHSRDLARINLAAYIQDLTAQILRSYQAAADRITLTITASDAWLNLDTAIPCGLILQEVMSNCLKHAFPAGRSGEIAILLRAAPAGEFFLTVRDNGVGFPDGVDFREAGSLGLQLVAILAAQLNGTIALERGEGTAFTLTFAELPARASR